MPPLLSPGLPGVEFSAGFPGGSQVVDAGGEVLARGGAAENVALIATVRLPGPAAQPATCGGWRKFSALAPHPALLRAIFAVDEALGAAAYRCSRERRKKALAASQMADDVRVPMEAPEAAVWLAAACGGLLVVSGLMASRRSLLS